MPSPTWIAKLLTALPALAHEKRIHLAVFSEPFLSCVLNGRKTLESRFSKHKIAPYRAVAPNDVLLIKAASGPIVAWCRIKSVRFYELTPTIIEKIRRDHAEALCAKDAAFWEARSQARYGTLMELADVEHLDPIPCKKTDRRGWVVLR